MKAAAGNPWRFGTAAVLGHLQVFSRRLSDLADMCTSALHFSRLERIEVGGSAVRPAHQCSYTRNLMCHLEPDLPL